MFFKEPPASKQRKCQSVARITDEATYLCLQPATVCLTPGFQDDCVLLMCLDCAHKLAIEILESVPGGRLDAAVLTAKRKARQ